MQGKKNKHYRNSINSSNQPYIVINGKKIGLGYPAYIVAEMSCNHGQDYQRAVRIVEAAKRAGADAVKLQTYTADTMTIDVNSDLFRHGKGSLWEGKTLYDLYQTAYTPWEWYPKLKMVAGKIGIGIFSTAFDHTAVDFLERHGVPIHKVASYENIDISLIKKMAQTGKPLIISTGMATLGEIEEAVMAARNAGAKQVALLKCTSIYPAPPEEMSLRTIPLLSDAFNAPVGLSDHTLGATIPIAAVGLGACIIEKHFTLSRSINTPDKEFSLEPDEFKKMVQAIRMTEKALGQVNYEVGAKEVKSRKFRRSLFVVANIKKGEKLTRKNVHSIRPGYGLSPKYFKKVLGKTARRAIKRGTPLDWDLID